MGGGLWGMPESLLPQRPPPDSPAGSHPPADGGVHLLPGAGEDSATAAEHPAQAVHPGSACLRALGTGWEGMGQDSPSWLRRGCCCSSCGQGETLCPNEPGVGGVLHPPGRAGEPSLTWHPLPGRGRRAAVLFSIWDIGVQPSGSSGSGVARLNRPGCHGVRSGFAQG